MKIDWWCLSCCIHYSANQSKLCIYGNSQIFDVVNLNKTSRKTDPVVYLKMWSLCMPTSIYENHCPLVTTLCMLKVMIYQLQKWLGLGGFFLVREQINMHWMLWDSNIGDLWDSECLFLWKLMVYLFSVWNTKWRIFSHWWTPKVGLRPSYLTLLAASAVFLLLLPLFFFPFFLLTQ